MTYRRICGAIALVLLAGLTLAAQTFRGTIVGTVTDPSGAVVVGAKVTVKNVDTGLERTATTDDTGFFSVTELAIGNYSVSVEQQGFQRTVASGVRVEVAAERRVDITLQPGTVSQTAEVTASVPLVETSSNVLGGSFESKQVLDMPLNGRDFTKLLIMVPGAAGEPNAGGDSPGSFGLFSVNGNRGRSNNFLLDGTDMNDGYRNLPSINQGGVFGVPGTVLPIEAIAELRVLSNFEAEYGRNSGGVVNIVTKSGTNSIHGSVFEYIRHNRLNARNFFEPEKSKFNNNQFGVSVGGPFVKDRTFWYLAYEGQREHLGVASANTVPALADFADAVNTLGGDPSLCTTSVIDCLNGQTPGIINDVILNLFNFCDSSGGCSGGRNLWPAANLSGAGSLNNLSSAPAFAKADSLIVKVDHSFDDSNQISGRYFFGDSEQSFPLGLGGGNNLPATNTFSPIQTRHVSLSYVHLFSGTQVNEARFGWNRYDQDFLAADRDVFGNPNDTIGMNTGVSRERDFGLPTLTIGGLASLGSSAYSNPRGREDTNWHFIDNVSWKMGRHDVKFGYEFRRTTVDSFYDALYRGRLDFDDLAGFLGGSVSGGRIARGNSDRQARQNSHAAYIQDSYRWASNFTLNIGLRWDYYGVISEAQGRFSVYDPAVGLVLKNPLYPKDWNNFGPRASFAWDVWSKGKTVVRGGFGIFYDIFSQDFFTGQIPWNCFLCTGVAYNPIDPDAVLLSLSPAGLAPGVPVFPTTLDSTDIYTVNNLKTPYVYNYNVNIQQELFTNTMVQVGYVGSSGHKLFRSRDINQPGQAAIDAHDPSLGCCVPRPFDSAAVLSPVAPNSPFYVNQLETTADSRYHGLQVSLRQTNWRGWNNQVSWTWSHSIDTASDGQEFVPNGAQPNDSTHPERDRGNSNFDTRHRLVWSATYDIPKHESLGKFGEGWQLSGVLTLMSGHPFNINYFFNDDWDGSGEFYGRPDVVGPIVYNHNNPFEFLDLSSFQVPCTLDPTGDGSSVFCIPGTQHFGNLGRNALIGPDYRNVDFAVVKTTSVSERFSLQFRADFFNLTNHTNFANPYLPAFFAPAAPNDFEPRIGTGVDCPVGVVPATGRSCGFLPIVETSDVGLGNPILAGGSPRSIQFAIKLIF